MSVGVRLLEPARSSDKTLGQTPWFTYLCVWNPVMIGWLRENVWKGIDFFPPWKQRILSGCVLIAGLGAMGGIIAWRSGQGLESETARHFWIFGAALGLGVMSPAIGRYVFCGLMGVVSIIGYTVIRVILGVVFVLIFVPMAIGLRIFSKDLLNRRGMGQPGGPKTAWIEHKPPAPKSQYHHLS